MMLAPILTPHGALMLRPTADAPELTNELGARLDRAFARGSGHGLLWLGANEVGAAMVPVLSYWRDFGAQYVTALCALPTAAAKTSNLGRTTRSRPEPKWAALVRARKQRIRRGSRCFA